MTDPALEATRLRPAAADGALPSAAPVPITVSASARRLAVAIRITAFVFFLYFLLYTFIWWQQSGAFAQIVSLVVCAVSLAMASRLLARPRGDGAVSAYGMSYELLVCLGIALTDYPGLRAMDAPPSGVSWTCVVIVLFHALLPASPSAVLLASLLAASMNALGFVISVELLGAVRPEPSYVVSLLMPPYLCALLAWVPARVLSRLRGELQRARTLGSYELVERLGQGAMGEVWRARHRLLARPAAIKLIRPDALGLEEPRARLLERFHREAEATAELESPHTVMLYDFGVSGDGVLYHVMELLRGIDLDALVRRWGPLPPERVVDILVQACDSLEDAHSRGLVHRDIKPANLFLGRTRRRYDFVKVLDFGLVKRLGPISRDDVSATHEGVVAGTPAFLAPESVTGAEVVDGRADLYSLGCTAYWLLTGRYVFEASTAMKMAVAHATAVPEPPSRHAPSPVPQALEAIVMRCLAKEPDERPPDAAALAAALLACPLAEPWTQERARAWWEERRADLEVHPAPRDAPASRILVPRLGGSSDPSGS